MIQDCLMSLHLTDQLLRLCVIAMSIASIPFSMFMALALGRARAGGNLTGIRFTINILMTATHYLYVVVALWTVYLSGASFLFEAGVAEIPTPTWAFQTRNIFNGMVLMSSIPWWYIRNYESKTAV